MIPIIEELRAATRDAHARLHEHPSFSPLMGLPPDPYGYARLLRQLHGFHASAEPWLLRSAAILLPELDDVPQRHKVHLLEADIAALEGIFPGSKPPDIRFRWSMTATRPAVLGGLYVIEGATLGGRELGRRLEPVLGEHGLRGTAGRQFFLAYEPTQGTMWRRFCSVLASIGAGLSPAERHRLCESAQQTFLAMEDWLTQCNRKT